jgi:hypothetical protein
MLMPLAPLGALPGAMLPQESRHRTLIQIVGFLIMVVMGIAIIYVTKGQASGDW